MNPLIPFRVNPSPLKERGKFLVREASPLFYSPLVFSSFREEGEKFSEEG